MASPTRIGTDTITTASASEASWTVSHTVPSTGVNRALIVASTAATSGINITGITYNGVGMSNIFHQEATQRQDLDMYYLANPATGANNIIVTWAGSQGNKVMIAFTLQDCVQSSPTDGTNGANAASVTALSASVTSTVDDDLYLVWMTQNNGSSYVDNGTQTRIGTEIGWNGTDQFMMSEDPQASFGAKSVGYSWTTAGKVDLGVVTLKYDPTAATSFIPKITIM